MRLLHSKALKLSEYTERDLPPYVILSHTWETEEVSFQDMQAGVAAGKKGYKKIQGCCKIAAAAGFEYVWVDTCCIDKTSSAELSEAINSMFSWYQKADVCYVYLSDYHSATSLWFPDSTFRDSRWFRRGWTLQELIAPESVIFFNSEWQDCGTKHSLRMLISEITESQVEALIGAKLEDFSVAQRMCWASRRQTTRIEDEAYSLIGIFGVHMPMLYGEGVHAFIRLQEEIIKTSTDHTIFAWATSFPTTRYYSGGLLADCPSTFAYTRFIISDSDRNTLPFETTNKGIHLHLPIYQDSFGILDCHDVKKPGFNLALKLNKSPTSSDTFQFDYYCGTVSLAVEERENLPIQSIYIENAASLVPLTSRFQGAEFFFELVFPARRVLVIESFPYSSLAYPQKNGLLDLSKPGTIIRGPAKDFCALLLWSAGSFAVIVNTTDPGNIEVRVITSSYTTRIAEEAPLDLRLKIINEFKDWRQETWKERQETSTPIDRCRWQHPVYRWWISVGTRRAIVSGKRVIIVTIKDETGHVALLPVP
jgi:hypothetical protein